jgi:hypothetical protein
MAEIEVSDLMRTIREGAREAAKQTEPSSRTPAEMLGRGSHPSPQGNTANAMARLQTSLTITARTQDQLPPVTTYRRGFLARVELWIKRYLKRATHWFTWEQVNFNSSVHVALNNMLAILQTYEQRLASLQNELDSSVAAKSNLEAQLIELESSLALVESRFDELLAEKTAEIRIEHQQRIELLLNERRVWFKQLALEISEAGVVADRAKRSTQLRLEELADRVDELIAEQRARSPVGRELAEKRDLL